MENYSMQENSWFEDESDSRALQVYLAMSRALLQANFWISGQFWQAPRTETLLLDKTWVTRHQRPPTCQSIAAGSMLVDYALQVRVKMGQTCWLI